jgi:hypothetical protein
MVTIKVRKRIYNKKTIEEQKRENKEAWVAYWRANPHRFITEWLGLQLYDFQKILIYQMNMYPNFIFLASRGLAKGSVCLNYTLKNFIIICIIMLIDF